MSSNVRSRQGGRSRSHAGRVRDLAQKKRNDKHKQEIRVMLLSLQILIIIAVFSVVGFFLDQLIGWSRQYYIAVFFLILGIAFSVWFAKTIFNKKR